tara:strand:- start:740 stop:952 length:213 start_codon:yes stop_codon:yes gene_type:complete
MEKTSTEMIKKLELAGVAKSYISELIIKIEEEKAEERRGARDRILDLFNFEGKVGDTIPFLKKKIKNLYI